MKNPKEPSSDKILAEYQRLNELDWRKDAEEDDILYPDDEVDEWDNFSNDDYFD